MALEQISRGAAGRSGWLSRSLELPGFLLHLLLSWQDRWRQRQMLMEMDTRLLRDVGLTRNDADQESRKPFWTP